MTRLDRRLQRIRQSLDQARTGVDIDEARRVAGLLDLSVDEVVAEVRQMHANGQMLHGLDLNDVAVVAGWLGANDPVQVDHVRDWLHRLGYADAR